MRNALTLMTVSFLGITACAVDSGTPPTETATSSALSTDLPVPAPEAASGTTPITQDLACSKIWECDEICGFYTSNGILVRYSTNVLHEYCSDGSDTVVRADACGEACF